MNATAVTAIIIFVGTFATAMLFFNKKRLEWSNDRSKLDETIATLTTANEGLEIQVLHDAQTRSSLAAEVATRLAHEADFRVMEALRMVPIIAGISAFVAHRFDVNPSGLLRLGNPVIDEKGWRVSLIYTDEGHEVLCIHMIKHNDNGIELYVGDDKEPIAISEIDELGRLGLDKEQRAELWEALTRRIPTIYVGRDLRACA